MPDIPEELIRILARALDKELETRYATVEEMAFDLKALAEASNHDRAAELLATATRLMEEEDWTNARAVLLQAQRLDPNEHGTKVLLSEVQQRLSLEQREQAQPERSAPKRRRKVEAQATAVSKPKRAPRRKPAKVEPEAAPEPANEAPSIPAFEAAETEAPDDSLTRILQASEFTREEESASNDSPFLLPEELTARFSEAPKGDAEPAAVPEAPLAPALVDSAVPEMEALPTETSVPSLRGTKSRKLRWLPAAAVFAIGVPLLATEMLYARRDSPIAAKPASAPAKPSTASASAPVQSVQQASRQASLVVQAMPWATVLDVTDASGATRTLPRERSTPLRLDALEAGAYKVRMASAAGVEKIVECTAAPGGQLCTAEFATPDPARFLSARR